MKTFLRSLLCSTVLATGLGAAQAANFVLVNVDPAGVGFNDPTPVAAVGGNNGATLGEQRLNVYYRAFELWGQVIDSPQPIVVQATWAALSCTATSGVLGSAGTTSVFRDFPGARMANHWYHSALADKLAGEDLNPGAADIRTFFNINLGKPGCLQSSGWYYGLDNNEAPNQIDFLSVLMHEVAHGLGFSNFVNEGTGVMLAGIPDIYMASTRDRITLRQWDDPVLTDADRAASGVGIDTMVWNNNHVRYAASKFLSLYTGLQVNAPAPAAGQYDLAFASFGPKASPDNFAGEAVYAIDSGGVNNPYDGCDVITNGGDLVGKIAIIDRGTCPFVTKVKNAQNAGAIGVMVMNNTAGLPGMGGADPTITIPSIGAPQGLGTAIKSLGGVASVAVFVDPSRRVGADYNGNPFLYAPAVYAPGSTGSHFDVSASPNALMEPAINADLHPSTNVDMTAGQFHDIGWDMGNFTVGGCNSGVRATRGNGDVLVGPVLQCRDHAVDHDAFMTCTSNYLNQLAAQRVISGRTKGRLTACAAKM